VADDERRAVPEQLGSRQGDYRMARIVVAGGLVFVLSILLLLDALQPDYQLQATTLGVMSTMILVLLGIEATTFLRGGK
jgi:hypothetical protein